MGTLAEARHDRRAAAAQQTELAGQMLAELRAVRAKMSEHVAALSGLVENGILDQGVAVLDANGTYSRDFRAPFAAVSIVHANPAGGTTITVTNAARSMAAPGPGSGMFDCPAGAAMVRNMVGSSVSFYGAAGTRFSYTVFVKPQAEAFGRVT